tara:strand:+ start:289 stop:471 length:183 start_codon:yes stop_codon:yes gene_type:complete
VAEVEHLVKDTLVDREHLTIMLAAVAEAEALVLLEVTQQIVAVIQMLNKVVLVVMAYHLQ